jgi:AcrR family transcriptional regulator
MPVEKIRQAWRLYNKGLSLTEVSAEVGCSRQNLHYHFKTIGLELRGRREGAALRRSKIRKAKIRAVKA